MSNHTIPTDKTKKRAFWQDQISLFNHNDLPAAQFCREQNLPYKTFMNWCKRLSPETVSAKQPGTDHFVRLSAPPAPASSTIKCRFLDGVEITWNNNTPAAAIAALIHEVRAL